MKKLLVIGFEPFNESMYPHCYEVLQYLSKVFELTYTDCDDRGKMALQVGKARPKGGLRFLLRWLSWYRSFRGYQSWLEKARSNVNALVIDQDIILAMDHTALDLISENLLQEKQVFLWSLDFYSNDHFWRQDSLLIEKVVERNVQQMSRLKGILVQDYRRSAVLDDILLSHELPKFFLPVAINDLADSETAGRKRGVVSPLNIGQIGSVNKQRGSDLLINEINQWGEEYRLLIKGHIDEEIRMMTDLSNALIGEISPDLRHFREFIGKIDIGVVLCPLKNLNNTFFAMASGQMVEYFRLGIPVISVGMNDMENFLSMTGGGVGVEQISELKDVVIHIEQEYGAYSEKARKTYEQYFDLESYQKELEDFLNF